MTSRIPGIEDVFRGCSYYGDHCDPEYEVNGKTLGFENRDSVMYDGACCMGDFCNSATSLSVGDNSNTATASVGDNGNSATSLSVGVVPILASAGLGMMMARF